jgi:hypothetical protein
VVKSEHEEQSPSPAALPEVPDDAIALHLWRGAAFVAADAGGRGDARARERAAQQHRAVGAAGVDEQFHLPAGTEGPADADGGHDPG